MWIYVFYKLYLGEYCGTENNGSKVNSVSKCSVNEFSQVLNFSIYQQVIRGCLRNEKL